MRRLIIAIAFAIPLPVFAQDGGPAGIAFVQAPEQSSGMAFGATPAEAFAAATAICMESGAYAEECIPTNWCQPAGWSVDAFVMHAAGNHWHEVVCGLASDEVAKAVGNAICDTSVSPYITECLIVQLYDPQGNPQMEY